MRWAALLLLGATAWADPNVELALGLEAFHKGLYGGAVEHLEAAYRIDPQPATLFSVAQAQRLSGQCEGALATYQAFLDTRPGPLEEGAARAAAALCRTPGRVVLASRERHIYLGSQGELLRRPHSENGRRSPAALLEWVRPPPPAQKREPWYGDWLGATLATSGLVLCGGGGGLWAAGNQYVDATNSAATYGAFSGRQEGLSGARALQDSGAAIVGIGGALMLGSVIRYAVVARRQ